MINCPCANGITHGETRRGRLSMIGKKPQDPKRSQKTWAEQLDPTKQNQEKLGQKVALSEGSLCGTIIAPEILSLLSPPVARQFGIIPVALRGETVILLCGSELSQETLAKLTFVCGNLDFKVASTSEYQEYRNHLPQLIEKYYPPTPRFPRDACHHSAR
jgi:hypothetical protein